MKLRLSALAVSLGLVVACSAAGCSEETIRVVAAPDGGDADGGGEGGLAGCTPGSTVNCTCPGGEAGKAECEADRSPGLCGCATTSLTSHTIISRGGKSALEVETHLAAAPDGALASVWISLGGAGTSDIG